MTFRASKCQTARTPTGDALLHIHESSRTNSQSGFLPRYNYYIQTKPLFKQSAIASCVQMARINRKCPRHIYIMYRKGQEVLIRWQKRPNRHSLAMRSNRMAIGANSKYGNGIASSMACQEGMPPSTTEGAITETLFLRQSRSHR